MLRTPQQKENQRQCCFVRRTHKLGEFGGALIVREVLKERIVVEGSNDDGFRYVVDDAVVTTDRYLNFTQKHLTQYLAGLLSQVHKLQPFLRDDYRKSLEASLRCFGRRQYIKSLSAQLAEITTETPRKPSGPPPPVVSLLAPTTKTPTEKPTETPMETPMETATVAQTATAPVTTETPMETAATQTA